MGLILTRIILAVRGNCLLRTLFTLQRCTFETCFGDLDKSLDVRGGGQVVVVGVLGGC